MSDIEEFPQINSILQLKQVALVASDINQVVSTLTDVFGLEVACRNHGVEQFGLVNAVIALDETFIEVVSPDKEGTAAGRLLEKRAGDGGYMVLFQTNSMASQKRCFEKNQVPIVLEAEVEGTTLIHLHPRTLGAIVSVDEMNPQGYWVWAGPDYKIRQNSALVTRLQGVELQSSDPEALALSWAKAFDQIVGFESGIFQIEFDHGVVRFTEAADGRGDGVSGIFLGVKNKKEVLARADALGLKHDDEQVEIGGVQFYLQE